MTNKDAYDKKSFWDYAKWGGLPNRCEFNEEINIKNYLHGVFDSIILRDVVIRLGLKDTTLFNMILHYLIDTTGREFSADNILKYLEKEYKKVSTETLYTYLEALCKSLLIKKVYRYDIHGKAVLKTLNKYYVTDLGIAQIKNNSSNFEDYIILENIVYNELLYKGYEIYIGKTKTGEVDNQTKYIQVTYEMKNETTREREFNAFNGINDSYPKYIISLDDKDYSKEGIINLNLIDFLMKEEF